MEKWCVTGCVWGLGGIYRRPRRRKQPRFAAVQACEQQLHQFRSLSGSLVRWLQTAQDQLPSKEANLNTEGLQRRVQQLQVCNKKPGCFRSFKDLLNDWESQRSRIQDLNKTGSELESLIIDITAPQTKTGVPQINGSAGPSSVNGIHTCKVKMPKFREASAFTAFSGCNRNLSCLLAPPWHTLGRDISAASVPRQLTASGWDVNTPAVRQGGVLRP
ncbi:hypothetical protein CCH79_00017394 [Gambusia affinis]|uniref:Uncharacterized protein n=1 Tax=Gambusia affinis TaxID=33528 RepID=A0A315W9E4_GAMAF|nr:hypothetical protein CCH79_00017394 [Gambusia affinis]